MDGALVVARHAGRRAFSAAPAVGNLPPASKFSAAAIDDMLRGGMATMLATILIDTFKDACVAVILRDYPDVWREGSVLSQLPAMPVDIRKD